MSSFELEIWDDEYDEVTFYTVRKLDNSETETDKFIERFAESKKEALTEILLIINEIGDNGAVDDFFTRRENLSTALPPKFTNRSKFISIRNIGRNPELRLFCYRVNEEIVILFNGGIKDAQTAQDSSLAVRFREAEEFSLKIYRELADQMIVFNSYKRTLEDFRGNSEIIL